MDDLSRAVIESVAWDVLRCMEVVTAGRLGGSTAQGVTLGGAGTGLPLWVDVLTSILGIPAVRHRSGEAASAGAALLAGRALGMGLTLEQLDPVEAVITPDPGHRRALPAHAAPGRTRGHRGPRRHRGVPVGRRRARAARPVLVELAYGAEGRTVEVPDDATVIVPIELPGLADQQGAVRRALDMPAGRAVPGRVGRRRRPPGGRSSSPT